MKKVVLVTNIPTPYRIPLFNELNRQLQQENWSLHVIFAAATYKRRKFSVDPDSFEFNHSFLHAATIQRDDVERTTFLYNGLNKALLHLKPDAIIVSGFSPATARVFARHLIFRTPYFIWNGSVISPYRKDGLIKSIYRKILASNAAGCIVYGSRARKYIESLGVTPEKINIAINTVDADYFRDAVKCCKENHAAASPPRLLCISYLSPRKNIQQVLEVMRRVVETRPNVILDLVGDCEQREELEKFSKEHGLEHNIIFHGYVQKESLPPLMANASAFLFQTDFDIWGLVLNEAMAAGLPVFCSPNAGAADDLIRDQQNGFIVDFNQPKEVAAQVLGLIDQPDMLNAIGQAATASISKHASLELSARGFVSALKSLQ